MRQGAVVWSLPTLLGETLQLSLMSPHALLTPV